MSNDQGQIPCVVASYLEKQCVSGCKCDTSDRIRMCMKTEAVVMLPSLEELILAGCATEDGVIADMLLARRAKTDRLRYVSVSYDSGTWAYRRPRDEEVIEEFFEPE